MKIFQLNLQRHYYGGGELATLLLSRGLREAGHDVSLLCPPEAKLTTLAGDYGVPTIPFSARGQFDLVAILRLARLLRKHRPQVVHMHTAREFVTGCLAGRLARVPAIVITRHLALPIKPRMRWMYSSACHLVICAAGAVQQSLLEGGIPKERTVVIHEPVDAATVRAGVIGRAEAKVALGLAPETTVVGTVGSLILPKGQRYLLEAVQVLVKNGFRGKVLLAGEGPLRAELEALATSLGVAEFVTFLGFRDDIPRVVSAFDVFVLPSITGEAFPLSILEAMVAGIPVVGTRLSGIPEAVFQDETGLLAEPADSAGLADAIGRLLNDSALCEHVAKNAKERVGQYDYKVMTQAVLRAYATVTGS